MYKHIVLCILVCIQLHVTNTTPAGKSELKLTSSQAGDLELCEVNQRVSGRPYRYYNKTDECFATSARGPCGFNMLFYPEINNDQYGLCECTRSDYYKLIYWPERNRCYDSYTKGPCMTGECIAVNVNTGKSYCQPRNCSAPSLVSASGSGGSSTGLNIACPPGKILVENTCQTPGTIDDD